MKNTISISEAIAEIALPGGGIGEIHASAEGTFDEAHSILTLTLDSALRPFLSTARAAQPEWLPASQTVREHVSSDEATTLARDIFRHWVGKVRDAIPAGALHAGAAQTCTS